jgi:hypothetical protein
MKQRRLIVSAMAVAVALTVMLARPARTSSQGNSVVRAERFEVVSKEGKVAASIAAEPDGTTAVRLYDKKGRERTVIAINADGDPCVNLIDEGGVVRALINVSSDAPSATTLEIRDDAGATAELGVGRGRFLLHLTGKGLKRTSIHLPPHGKPTLTLQDGRRVKTVRP